MNGRELYPDAEQRRRIRFAGCGGVLYKIENQILELPTKCGPAVRQKGPKP